MPENKQIETHLDTLTASDWQRLFDLLPEIARTREFIIPRETMYDEDGRMIWTDDESPEIVYRTESVLYNLGLVPAFDWMSWSEGDALLKNPETRYDALDRVTLCKLITCIVRGDRFCGGFLAECFQQGIMQRILHAMYHRVHGRAYDVDRP